MAKQIKTQFNKSTKNLTILPATTQNDINISTIKSTLSNAIKHVDINKSAIKVIDDAGVNNFTTNVAKITLFGGSGNDKIVVKSTTNKIYGGAGNDSVNVMGRNNKIDTGAGSDFVTLSSGSNNVTLGAGNDKTVVKSNSNKIYGGAGSDTVSVTGSSNTISAGADNDFVTLSSGLNRVALGAGNDKIKINSAQNTVYGGTGNDSLIVSSKTNKIDAGAGNDFVTLSSGSNNVTLGAGNDKTVVKSNSNKIYGGAGSDTVSVTGSSNTISAGAGDDKVILSGDKKNIVIYTAGTDTISGYGDTDSIRLANGVTYSNAKKSDNDILVNTSAGTFTIKNAADKTINLLDSNGEKISVDFSSTMTITDSLLSDLSNVNINGNDEANLLKYKVGNSFSIISYSMSDNEYDHSHNAVALNETINSIFAENVKVSLGGGNDTFSSEGTQGSYGYNYDSDDGVIDHEITTQKYGNFKNFYIDLGDDDDYSNVEFFNDSQIFGGAGNDTIDIHYSENATVFGGAGNDFITFFGEEVIGKYVNANGCTPEDWQRKNITKSGKNLVYVYSSGDDTLTGLSDHLLKIDSEIQSVEYLDYVLKISTADGDLTVTDVSGNVKIQDKDGVETETKFTNGFTYGYEDGEFVEVDSIDPTEDDDEFVAELRANAKDTATDSDDLLAINTYGGTIDGGLGNDTLIGSSGKDYFLFNYPESEWENASDLSDVGNDVIVNYESKDKIVLEDYYSYYDYEEGYSDYRIKGVCIKNAVVTDTDVIINFEQYYTEENPADISGITVLNGKDKDICITHRADDGATILENTLNLSETGTYNYNGGKFVLQDSAE